MSNTKKSILIYFDNYPMVTSLPPEQRGWVLTALMVYGDRLTRQPGLDPEEVMEQFPGLSPEGRLVCGFMAASVRRDTQKWLDRQHARTAPVSRGRPPALPASNETVRGDMERTRRLMEQLQEEEQTPNPPADPS